MKRLFLAGAISATALIASIGSVSAAPAHHPNHGNKAAAHSCPDGSKTAKDAHGDCVSAAAKARH